MNELISLIMETLQLDAKHPIDASSSLSVICPGSTSRSILAGKIEARYSVHLTNTELASCHTVAEIKGKIDLKKKQQHQASMQGRCNMSIQRERMISHH